MPGCQDQIGKDIVPQDCGTSTKGLLCPEKREGETMETVTDFIFLGSKTTADGDCSHEIKRSLLLGRKAMYDQLRYHIKKQRHYFADKVSSSQSCGFSLSIHDYWKNHSFGYTDLCRHSDVSAF